MTPVDMFVIGACAIGALVVVGLAALLARIVDRVIMDGE